MCIPCCIPIFDMTLVNNLMENYLNNKQVCLNVDEKGKKQQLNSKLLLCVNLLIAQYCFHIIHKNGETR